MASIKDLKRMCNTYDECKDCPLSTACSGYAPPNTIQDNADEIVDKWVSEHPVKTYAMDFLKKFPNARLYGDKTPTACRDFIYNNGCPKRINIVSDCADCWDMEMKEDA